MKTFNWKSIVAIIAIVSAIGIYLKVDLDGLPYGELVPAMLLVLGIILALWGNSPSVSRKTASSKAAKVVKEVGDENKATDEASKVMKEDSFQLIGWIGFGLSLLCVVVGPLAYFFSGNLFVNLLGVLAFVGSGFIFRFLVWDIFKRWLADRALFFVRLPEMTAAFVEKDRKLFKILINASTDRRKHFEALAKMKNRAAGYQRFVLVEHGQEIIWLGLPWIFRLKTSWYEYSDDIKNPRVDPRRFLDLMIRNIDFGPKGEEGGVVPFVDTADPIQVKARLVLELQIWDPEAALYGVQHYMEAVQKDVVALWRRVISELSYFEAMLPGGKKQKTGDLEFTLEEMDINPAIQRDAFARLIVVLGIGYLDDNGNIQIHHPVISPDFSSVINDYDPETRARTCREEYGVEMITIEVVDLDPADDSVRAAIQDKTKAKAEAAAAVQTARGQEQVAALQGQGEKKRLTAHASALREFPEGHAILALEATEALAKGGNLIITEGGIPAATSQITAVISAMKGTVPVATEDEATPVS